MRKKISTLLDDALFRRVKLEAARQGKQISEIMGEALEAYVAETGKHSGARSVAAESFGAVPAPPEVVRAILEEEDSLLDT